MNDQATEVGRFRDRHEQHLTHRLETFSEIVIGFSLGQMALSLVIPRHPIELYTNPTALVAFAFTFLNIAFVWYVHHRLFEYFFVPRPLTIVLNFLELGLVVWLVYELEIYAHFATSSDHASAALGYATTFSILWILFCAQFVTCARIRWHAVTAEERRGAMTSIGRTGAIGFGTLLCAAVFYATKLPVELAFWLIWVWAIAWRAAAPAVLRRIA